MNRIVVIGCQRSGTNIVAACIAHDKGLEVFNERDLGYSSCVLSEGSRDLLIEFMNNTSEFVLQAPSLNYCCDEINEWLDERVEFVWVRRDQDEIRKSRARVDWSGEEKEVAKYQERFSGVLKNAPIKDSIEMASYCFHLYQKTKIPHRIVAYNSFIGHPLWKTDRQQLRIGEV